jgi:hypothetical protein
MSCSKSRFIFATNFILNKRSWSRSSSNLQAAKRYRQAAQSQESNAIVIIVPKQDCENAFNQNDTDESIPTNLKDLSSTTSQPNSGENGRCKKCWLIVT